MLTNPASFLREAHKHGRAVAAFNAENAEMVFAIVDAANKLGAPVMIQTTPSTLKYLPPVCFYGIVKAAAESSGCPVALHLDHGDSLDLVKECLAAGYTSVMFDGSKLPLAENIAQTKQAARLAKEYGAACEGEVGTIGGKEDDLSGQTLLTNPADAEIFARQTGVDSFAPAVGTSHGLYKAPPKVDIALIKNISDITGLPLVLHGATGLDDSVITAAIAAGVCKVNFATGLRVAFSRAVKEYIVANPDVYDPKKYLAAGRAATAAWVKEKILLCRGEK